MAATSRNVTFPSSISPAYEWAARALVAGEAPIRISVPEVSSRLIEETVRGLFEFDRYVPRAEQERWCINVPRDQNDPTPDDGIIRRDNGTTDQKIFFHFRPELRALLQEAGVVVEPHWGSWLATSEQLYHACMYHALELMRALDRISPEVQWTRRFRQAQVSRNKSVLRVVKYAPGTRGFAKIHTDRDGFTFHLHASEPGLFFVQDGASIYPNEPAPGEALVFPGQTTEKLTQGKMCALEHGSSASMGDRARSAVVFFGKLAT